MRYPPLLIQCRNRLSTCLLTSTRVHDAYGQIRPDCPACHEWPYGLSRRYKRVRIGERLFGSANYRIGLLSAAGQTTCRKRRTPRQRHAQRSRLPAPSEGWRCAHRPGRPARWHCHAIRGNVGAGGQSRAAGQAPAQACTGSEAIVAGRLARGWRAAEGDRRVKLGFARNPTFCIATGVESTQTFSLLPPGVEGSAGLAAPLSPRSNSLFLEKNSLIRVCKFPALLRREFA